MATDHPLRLALNDEVHGRPALHVPEPAKISHFAFTESQPGSARQAVMDLCRRLGAQEPNPDIGHHTITPTTSPSSGSSTASSTR